MSRQVLGAAALVLAAGCSDWMLAESGYSLDVAAYGEEFAIRVHVNELRQLGGDIDTPLFHHYVAERLKRRRLCPGGWERQLCAEIEQCVHRTDYSVTVYGRCVSQ
jgi:hypothetical protein